MASICLGLDELTATVGNDKLCDSSSATESILMYLGK